ncbi:MAG: trypsin-like serine protease, partial [Polyangiaceae bacterium]
MIDRAGANRSQFQANLGKFAQRGGALVLGFAVFGGALGCGEHEASSTVGKVDQAIIDGTDASSQVKPEGFVKVKTTKVLLDGNGSLNIFTEQGSGVLLTNEWVLTAAHVVDAAAAPGSVTVTLDGSPQPAADVIIHPQYRRSTLPNVPAQETQPLLLDNVDMALVRLATPINS